MPNALLWKSLLRDVMAEMNLAGDLRHVTDVKEIGQYGVMGVPALIINGKVVAVGSVPEKKKIQPGFRMPLRKWLKIFYKSLQIIR